MPTTTLTSGISDTDTTLTLTSFTGFPKATENQAWELDLSSGSNFETVRVIDSSAAPILTIMRGFRGTTAQAWLSGTTARLKGSAFSVDEQKQNKGGTPINGTKSQYNTALTDGDFLFVGDIIQYTDEMSQDATASLIQNGTGITWNYSDGSNTLTPTVTITQYTDELAQDAVGGMTGTSLIYNDSGATLQRAALTGDVTASQDSNATTIANDSVTYAKMQNVSATDKLLGRSTSGSGDVEEIACTAAGRALIDDATASDQRTTLGLGTLATQSGTFSGTSSGTNTGDQTSIVGITGTKAQFDTAVTDGNILYVGDAYVPGGTDVPVADGGTGRSVTVAYAPIVGGTTTTAAMQSVLVGSAGQVLQSGGSSAIPVYSTATYPATAGTTRKILVSDGTNIVSSTETYAVPGTSGNVLTSDGTNWTSAAAVSGLTQPQIMARLSVGF